MAATSWARDILLPSVGFNTTMGGKQYDFGIPDKHYNTSLTSPENCWRIHADG